jgi:hypothetical protein
MITHRVSSAGYGVQEVPETGVHEAVVNLFAQIRLGTKQTRRAAIAHLEAEMLKLPQSEQPVEHRFVPGLYWRTITNPKDSFIVTKIHKEPNISTVLKGRLACITEDGMEILEAGMQWETCPGTKRVLYAVEETVFSTVHPNPEEQRDLEALEARIIAPDFAEIECKKKEAPCLG